MKMLKLLQLALCSVILSSCGGSQYPTSNGGTPVPGIADPRSYLDFTLSLSPNGRWLLYATSQPPLPGPHFTLYDFNTKTGHPTSYSQEAQLILDRRAPAPAALRWSGTSSLAAMPTGATRSLYVLKVDDTNNLKWIVAKNKQGLDLDESPLATVGARFSQENPREIEFVDGTTRTVARHTRRGRLGATAPTIQSTALSPSGRYLAYSIASMKIGSFANPPRLFVIEWPDNASSPQFLGAPVYKTLHWHPNRDVLFALSRDRTGKRQIIQWDVEDI